jgi:hypothetical protein
MDTHAAMARALRLYGSTRRFARRRSLAVSRLQSSTLADHPASRAEIRNRAQQLRMGGANATAGAQSL